MMQIIGNKKVLLLIWGLRPWLQHHNLTQHIQVFDGVSFEDIFLMNEEYAKLYDVPSEEAKILIKAIEKVNKQQNMLLKIKRKLMVNYGPLKALKKLHKLLPSRFIPLLGTLSDLFMEIMTTSYANIANIEGGPERYNSRYMIYVLSLNAGRNRTFRSEYIKQLYTWKMDFKKEFIPTKYH